MQITSRLQPPNPLFYHHSNKTRGDNHTLLFLTFAIFRHISPPKYKRPYRILSFFVNFSNFFCFFY